MTQWTSLGVEAHIGQHAGEEGVLGASSPHRHRLALQVADGADLLAREQLEAADMPRRSTQGAPGLQPDEDRPDEVRAEVDLASGGRLGE